MSELTDKGTNASPLGHFQFVTLLRGLQGGLTCKSGQVLSTDRLYKSHCLRFPKMWYVRPAKAQTSLRIRAV